MIDTDERPITKWTMKALTRQCLLELDAKYDLVYVDRGDRFTDDQVDMIVRGDWESLWESTDEWEGDQRHFQSAEAAKELSRAIAQRWERTFGIDSEYLLTEWDLTDEEDTVREAIMERDSGDWVKDLANGTPQVLMRHVLRGEDDAIWGNQWGTGITATDVIKWLREGCEEGTRLPRNPANVKVVRDVLAEAFHTQAVLMGMLVYAVSVRDFIDLPSDGMVNIINPHLYLGNYYHGDGYCEGPLDATIRVKREDMHTDKGAPGYGWDEVAGVVTSYYEAQIQAVQA